LKYAATDEWVKVEHGIATIGITDYAQEHLSDIVYLEVTVDVGDTVKKTETIATVESVKAAADVSSPVSGEVIEVNEKLSDSPESINEDPFGGAWMVKIKLANSSELDALMDAASYEAFCKERSS
jgi:glycine cleavage system H protein